MTLLSRNRRQFGLALFGLLLGTTHSIYTLAQQNLRSTPLRILVVGDSLSAEYGLQRGFGWVELLNKELTQTYPEIEIINASISGDTTSGGRARMQTLLERTKPNIVLIELGANDALRGLPLQMTKNNLLEMVSLVQAVHARPIIIGMQIPPNYGREYTTAFKNLFNEVSMEKQVALVPFLLEGIAADAAMFQADTIHPNERAQPILLENVRRVLMPFLK